MMSIRRHYVLEHKGAERNGVDKATFVQLNALHDLKITEKNNQEKDKQCENKYHDTKASHHESKKT